MRYLERGPVMRVLVWQWGRRGAGPLVAAALARELGGLAGVEALLSLSTGAELLGLAGAPVNDVPIDTYRNRIGFLGRVVGSPWTVPALVRAIARERVDVAVCAMPAALDLVMAAALRRVGVPYAVMVHDAERHPGDTFPMQMPLQRWLMRGSGLMFALTQHVAEQLEKRGMPAGRRLMRASLPPFVLGPAPAGTGAHGGRFRLLSFGRLLPYKGLDLLADALERLTARDEFEVRVVGCGPETGELRRLRALPNVVVENRWVPEAELGALLGWADGLVLSHREASQSGVAAAALAARRWIVATRVGGLVEQLQGQEMAVLCEPDGESIAVAIAGLPGRAVPSGQGAESWNGAEVIAAGLREMVLEREERLSRYPGAALASRRGWPGQARP